MQADEEKQAIGGWLALLSPDEQAQTWYGRTNGRLSLSYEAHVTQSAGGYQECRWAANTLIVQHITRSLEASRSTQVQNAICELKQTLGRLRRACRELHRAVCRMRVQYWVTLESGHASQPLACINEDEQLIWLDKIPD